MRLLISFLLLAASLSTGIAASLNVARGYDEIYWGASPYEASVGLNLGPLIEVYKPIEGKSAYHNKLTTTKAGVETTLYFINGMFCAFQRKLAFDAPAESPAHGPFNAHAFCERIEKALGEYENIKISCRAELLSGEPITADTVPPIPGQKVILILEVANLEQIEAANREGAGALKELYNNLEKQLISR